ncbi:hypothetical protein Tco_0357319 [Tanacetum coccineum]
MLVKEKPKAVRDFQKSYVDFRRKPLEFELGDHVLLKVTPWKGVMRFGKKGKLAPRRVHFWEFPEGGDWAKEILLVLFKMNLDNYEELVVLVTCRSHDIQIHFRREEFCHPLSYHLGHDIHIHFRREEFCLVTRLRFGVDYSDEYKKEGPIPFRCRAFTLAKDDKPIRGSMLEAKINSDSFYRINDHDAVSLCCVAILQFVLLGLEDRRKVPNWILRLANVRDDWDIYPWDLYVWPILYSHLRNANFKRWKPLYATEQEEDFDHNSYSLMGFTWAFKIKNNLFVLNDISDVFNAINDAGITKLPEGSKSRAKIKPRTSMSNGVRSYLGYRGHCLDSRKSTSGGIQFLGGDKLVSWSSKKQDCTSNLVIQQQAELKRQAIAYLGQSQVLAFPVPSTIDVSYHSLKGTGQIGMRCLTLDELEVLAIESA